MLCSFFSFHQYTAGILLVYILRFYLKMILTWSWILSKCIFVLTISFWYVYIWFYISNSGCDREEIYLLKLTACFFQFSSFFVHIFIVFPYLVAFKVSSVELIDTFSHEYTIFHYYYFFIEGIVFSVEEFNKQIVSVCFKITKLLLSFACYCYLPRFWM